VIVVVVVVKKIAVIKAGCCYKGWLLL